MPLTADIGSQLSHGLENFPSTASWSRLFPSLLPACLLSLQSFPSPWLPSSLSGIPLIKSLHISSCLGSFFLEDSE